MLKNSLLFTLFSEPLILVLGTATALFLNRNLPGVQILRALVLLPWVLPGAISGCCGPGCPPELGRA